MGEEESAQSSRLRFTVCDSRFPGNGCFVDVVTTDKSEKEGRAALQIRRSCAVVGSSASLVGAGRGAEIDGHDRVVRVNRLPTRAFWADFGTRTDVLYGNCWTMRKGELTLMGPPAKNCTRPYCYPTRRCNTGGPGCELVALIFKGFCVGGSWDLHTLRGLWGGAPFMVGVHRKAVMEEASAIPGIQKIRILSAGYLAFWLATSLCTNVTLYGFGDGATADGHHIDDFHNFAAEHVVYRKLAAGQSLGWKFKKDANHTTHPYLPKVAKRLSVQIIRD